MNKMEKLFVGTLRVEAIEEFKDPEYWVVLNNGVVTPSITFGNSNPILNPTSKVVLRRDDFIKRGYEALEEFGKSRHDPKKGFFEIDNLLDVDFYPLDFPEENLSKYARVDPTIVFMRSLTKRFVHPTFDGEYYEEEGYIGNYPKKQGIGGVDFVSLSGDSIFSIGVYEEKIIEKIIGESEPPYAFRARFGGFGTTHGI